MPGVAWRAIVYAVKKYASYYGVLQMNLDVANKECEMKAFALLSG